MLAGRIRSLDPPADISLTMKQVEALLDESIETEGYTARELGHHSNRPERHRLREAGGEVRTVEKSEAARRQARSA